MRLRDCIEFENWDTTLEKVHGIVQYIMKINEKIMTYLSKILTPNT